MPEGVPENSVAFFTQNGHDHDGENSTKLDLSKYDLSDIISIEDLEQRVRNIVNSGTLNPDGGIVIDPGVPGQPPIHLSPTVPGPATGLTATTGVNDDGTMNMGVTWNPIDGAESYILQLYRSVDSGANYIKVEDVVVKGISHEFNSLGHMGLVQTTVWKLIVQGQSTAGIVGLVQILANIASAVDTVAPGAPAFTTGSGGTNFFLSFRGFLARLNEQTEGDTKWGMGQFEYSISTNNSSTSNFDSNEVESGRQTGRIISVTGLATGTPYYLRVRAYDNSNNYSTWTYWDGTSSAGSATVTDADSFTPSEITGTEITDDSITTDHILANQITAAEIAAYTITSDEIEANSIDADRISINQAFIGHTIRSEEFDATAGSEEGWKINYDGTAQFFGNVTMHGATVKNSSFEVLDSATPPNLLFRVVGSGTDQGNVTIYGNLTVGDWAAGDAGLNWNNTSNVFSIKGTVVANLGYIGGWTIDADSVFAGTKDASGYTTSGITLSSASGGSLHAKNFYIDSGGDAYFRGLIEASTIQTGSSGPRIKLNPVGEVVPTTTNTGYVNNTQSANTLTTVELKAGASSYDNYYNGWTLTLTAGPGSGSVRTITDYVGSTKVATVDSNFSAVPTTSTQYRVEKIENMFLQGFTGDAEEDYSGFLYFYHDLEDWSNASSEHWGRVALSAPRYSATFAYAGFNFKHSNLGKGELSFGLPHHADQFVIADAGSSSTPTNTFNRGGITIVSGTPASTNNTLYADGTTLKWHGAAIGGSSGVDSIIAGSNITLSPSNGLGDVTVSATNTTYTASSPITLSGGAFGLDTENIVWASSTNMGISGYTGSMANADSFLVKNHTGNPNTAGNVYWMSTATFLSNTNVSTFNNDAGYITSSTVTYPLRGSDGSEAAPTYSFSNDTNTGMFRATSDQIGFSVGNSRRLTITTAGLYTIYGLFPAGDGQYNVGYSSSSYRWKNGWFTNDLVCANLTETSDVSLKTDVVDSVLGLDFVKALRPVSYKYIETEGRPGVRTHHGFIAQEVEAVLGDDATDTALWVQQHQEAVSAEDSSFDEAIEESSSQALRYTQFVPVLTKAIQELSTKLDAAEARLAALEA